MAVRAVVVLVDAPISDAVVTIVVEVATIAHHVMIEQCNMLLITDHFKAFEGTPIPMDISKIMVDTATKTSSEVAAGATISPFRDVETQGRGKPGRNNGRPNPDRGNGGRGPNPDEATDHGFGRRTPMVVTTSSLTLAFFFLEETTWTFEGYNS